MMKMMILAPRRPGMSRDEFRAYLTQIHGPLVKSVPEVAGDIRMYHYNFPLADQNDVLLGHPPASQLDVVTEALFDSCQALLDNMTRPRYLAEVRPDEGRFADEARAVMHCTHEIEIAPGARAGHKRFWFRRRRQGLSRGEFQSRWRCAMTEILAASPLWRQVVSRYVQNHSFPEELHPPGMGERGYDLIDQLDLPVAGADARLCEDARLLAAIRELEQELTDAPRTLTLACETHRNIG